MPVDAATLCAIAALAALVFLPGAALMAVSGAREADPGIRLGTLAGLGLAVQPLAALWARLAGVPMNELTIWGGLIICAGVILWRWRSHWLWHWLWHWRRAAVSRGHRGAAAPGARGPHLALAGIVAVLFAARWAVAAGLVVPLWGDSVHHSMIARLFALQAGLPRDWLPFEPLAPFTYHFGLHALTSAVATLSGAPEHRALLVVGQMLMVVQALTAYAFVAGLSGRRWAGVGAAVVAGGLGPMPGQYLNWGRYTQLAGQVILPVAALWLSRAGTGRARAPAPTLGGAPAGNRVEDPAAPELGARPGAIALAAVLVAGLALTHYLVTVFLVLFGVAWLLFGDVRRTDAPTSSSGEGRDPDADGAESRTSTAAPADGRSAAATRRGRSARRFLARVLRAAVVAAAALALAAPWIPQFLAGRLDDHATALMTTELPDPGVWGAVDPAWVWGQLGDFVGTLLVAAGVAATIWSVLRRNRAGLLGLAWTGGLIAAAYPSLFGVPITGVLKDFAVLIGLYVPLGLLIGPAFGRVVAWATTRMDGRWAALATVGFVAVLHVAGPTRTEIDPQAIYASAADVRAFEWIGTNTPEDAVFLVSAAPAYAGTVVAGDDGGWWLPQLAGRSTTLPPITYGLEPSIEPGYREAVNALNAAWREDLDASATIRALREAGVGWAYVGPRGGTLRVDDLLDSPNWEVAYEANGATVFKAAWAEAPARR